MGVTLSGGEQQMLAIGRALMTNPKLLILDEATEGLAPLIREEIWNCLSMLKGRGQSVLVIDKNVANLSKIADRHYIIERGRTVWTGTSEQLIAEPDLQHQVFGDLRHISLVVPPCERSDVPTIHHRVRCDMRDARLPTTFAVCRHAVQEHSRWLWVPAFAGTTRECRPLKTSRNIRGAPSPTLRPGTARSRRS